GAETAVDMFGGAETGRLSTRPGDGLTRRGDQGGKDIAHRLLAHAAVADMGIVQHFARVVAHRATLATAADFHGIALHQLSSLGGQSVVSWSGCWLEWIPARKSRHSSLTSWRSGRPESPAKNGWRSARL